jgi:hypothetical protein
MRHYIIHNSKEKERKEKLEKQLDEFNITDVEWVTTFPIEEIGNLSTLESYKPLSQMSCDMKHMDALDRMVKEGLEEAIIFENDVIFSDLYDEVKIPKAPYVKLGRGPPDALLPFSQIPRVVHNNGGNEGYYVNLEFASTFKPSMKWTMDIEQQAFLMMQNIPLVCVPMCYQEYVSTHTFLTPPITWIDFLHNFPSYEKYSFDRLIDKIKE